MVYTLEQIKEKHAGETVILITENGKEVVEIPPKYDLYLASGWFNEAQARDLENIKKVCADLNLKIYSPKDEIIVHRNATKAELTEVFDSNVDAIKKCRFVIVNTRDKDMGTIFEAGASWAIGKPIIYYCEGLKGNFNVMLANSGCAVATSLEELESHLRGIMIDINYTCEYKGVFE